MPTDLPRQLPTLWQGVQLYALLALFHWYGYRRRAAMRRVERFADGRGLPRWERAVRRWLACSAKIAALLGQPEPPQVRGMRDLLDQGDHQGPNA